MAIIKYAKNIKIVTIKKDVVLTGGHLVMNTQKKMIFDAIEENLEFISTKKIKAKGND